MNKIHRLNNFIIASVLKKQKNSNTSQAADLDTLAESLFSPQNTWTQFKRLFHYYYVWYKTHLISLVSVLSILLLTLFIVIIPRELPSFDLGSFIKIPTGSIELTEQISWTTEYAYHLLAIALLLIAAQLRKSSYLKLMSLAVLVSLIFSTISIRVSKIAFGRLRPVVAERLELKDTFEPFNLKHKYHSFPSGHTSSSFSTTTALLAANPSLSLPLLTYASYIGYTRISLKQHYPSDVLAGASVGILSALPALSLRRKYNQKKKTRT